MLTRHAAPTRHAAITRHAILVLAVAMAVGAWRPAVVRAAGAIEILREELTLSVDPAGGLTVCAGEKQTVSATLETLITYRLATDPASTLRTMTRAAGLAAVVRAVSDDPSIGDVTPQFQPALPPGGTARFTFEGKQPGRTSLRVSETQGAGFRGQTVGVAVDDCSYLVSLHSTWQIPDGFTPNLLSVSVGTLLTRTGTPGEFKGNGTTQNIAIGTPQGGCIPTFTAGDGTVRMTGRVDSGTLNLELAYLPVQVATVVDCIISGGRSDVATPSTIQVQAPADRTSTQYDWAHILRAYLSIPGRTEVRIELIRIPS